MTSIPALANALYREEVARARAMAPGEKLLEGPGFTSMLTARLAGLAELERS